MRLLLLAPLLLAQEKVDLYTINRLKAEEFQNSKVMENAAAEWIGLWDSRVPPAPPKTMPLVARWLGTSH